MLELGHVKFHNLENLPNYILNLNILHYLHTTCVLCHNQFLEIFSIEFIIFFFKSIGYSKNEFSLYEEKELMSKLLFKYFS